MSLESKVHFIGFPKIQSSSRSMLDLQEICKNVTVDTRKIDIPLHAAVVRRYKCNIVSRVAKCALVRSLGYLASLWGNVAYCGLHFGRSSMFAWQCGR